MKFKKLTLTIVAVLVAVGFANSALAADNDPVTVASILKAAGTPLTDVQVKQLADYTPPQRGGGTQTGAQAVQGQRVGGAGALYSLFDEKQTTALVAKLGSAPARGGNTATDAPARPNNLSQLIILERAGLPLTEKQVADMKNAADRAAMAAIYTEAQLAVPGVAGGGRGMGGRMGGGN